MGTPREILRDFIMESTVLSEGQHRDISSANPSQCPSRYRRCTAKCSGGRPNQYQISLLETVTTGQLAVCSSIDRKRPGTALASSTVRRGRYGN
ncbi:hypothetical protein ACHAXS_000748 [Conticribra weissflogii]